MLVPVGSAVLLRVVPEINAAIGVFLATIGLGVMSLTLPFRVETGDVLIFLCAIGFAAHILLVGIHSKHGDPAILPQSELDRSGRFLVAALCLEQPLVVPRKPGSHYLYRHSGYGGDCVGTIHCTEIHFCNPCCTMIYSAEPVFAAFFGWLMLGEVLSPREAVGAVLILAGMLVSELAPGKKQPAAQEQAAVSDQRF